jgi:hypothetical protein
MATNRDLLKEAIADAKAVKDMAIANAKAALEESFTPQLKSMLSAKLQEMELEEDELEETFGEFSDKGKNPDSSMFKKALDEEGELEEDLDLNELLNELNEEEEEEDMESEESEEEESEEGKPLDLEDMTDEDLKKMIEDVIADMMSSGELDLDQEADESEEMEDESEESEEEEEINLDELLAEIEFLNENEKEEMEDEGMMYEEELAEMEASDTPMAIGTFIASVLSGGGIGYLAYLLSKSKKWKVEAEQAIRDELKKGTLDAKQAGALISKLEDTKSPDEAAKLIAQAISPELTEAYSTIETLRSELNEVNLLNAKLLYTNKIFKAKTLTESQKLNVLSMFDKAKNVGEVKLVFETLSEGLKTKSTPIKENLGSASKIMGTTNTKQPIVESDPMVARFQKLAGIIK